MFKRFSPFTVLLGFPLALIAPPGFSQDSVSFSGGADTAGNSYIARIAYRHKLNREFILSSGRAILTFSEGSIGGWQGASTDDKGFVSLGLRYVLTTPLFDSKNTWFEFGTGPLVISDLHLNDDQSWGYKLQFDSHLGVRYHFKARPFAVGYGFHHISNAGLGDENHGLNLHMLTFRRRF